LVSGNVDAAVTWEPYISLTVTQDVTNLVATSGGYSREIDFIIADNAFLQKYPDITPRLLKALDKARLWADANKEEALKIVAADAGIDPSVLAPIFYKINTEVSIPEENIGWTTRTRDFLKKYKLIEDDVDINDLIDLSYLQKAGLQ
jgi:sulfonate transport system substrate-binding protein